MARMVGVSVSTVSRKRKRANMSAGERLSLVQSDRLYRVARTVALAMDVFEDKASALEWLNSKQAGLGSRVPLDMSQTTRNCRHETWAYFSFFSAAVSCKELAKYYRETEGIKVSCLDDI